jgi:hypothetical protein
MKRLSNAEDNDKILDRLLDEHFAGESEPLTPSSGFALSVMESIEAQATLPPPIAFPWSRVLPGLVAVLCGLVVFVLMLWRSAGSAATESHAKLGLSGYHAVTATDSALGWVLVAACLSVAAVAASFRMTGRSR